MSMLINFTLVCHGAAEITPYTMYRTYAEQAIQHIVTLEFRHLHTIIFDVIASICTIKKFEACSKKYFDLCSLKSHVNLNLNMQ